MFKYVKDIFSTDTNRLNTLVFHILALQINKQTKSQSSLVSAN